MKKRWRNDLENKLTELVSDVIDVPYRIECNYSGKTLSATLFNLERNKSYLIAAIRGKRSDGNAYIELFYVMPHFQGKGVGHTLLEFYSHLQKMDGEVGITLKPVPVLPENYNPWEYFRLYTWLGKKEHSKMSRQQLIDFYRSAGFHQIFPNDPGSEMKRLLTA